MTPPTWQVLFSDTAAQDLADIAFYIRESLHSPQAAHAFLDEVAKKLDLLETFPESCPPVSDFALAQAGYRHCIIRNYALFFLVNSAKAYVQVERVLYLASDWAEQIKAPE